MGSDKAFLPYPLAPTSSTSSNVKEGIAEYTESLWIHLLRILLRVCPEGVVVSHNVGQRERMEQDLKGFLDSESLSSSSPSNSTSTSTATSQTKQPLIELLPDAPSYTELGPAAALLTAHKTHPSTTFLVAAVDFPYITQQTLSYLLEHHTEPSPVTTYFHPSDMHPEPLLSVWAPEGLKRLRRNAIEGVVQADGGRRRRTGPCYTAKELWKEIMARETEIGGNVELATDVDGRDARHEENRGEKANVGISSEGNGKGAGDPDINAQAPIKGKEPGQKKEKTKDQLPPAIIRRFGVLPKIEGELRNTNTREEWDRAVEELRLKLKAGGGYGHHG